MDLTARIAAFFVLVKDDMKRIKTAQSLGRDYEKMLKEYFGKFLYGLSVERSGGQVRVQVVYFDYKHIDTVRRELAQMMPEVEFVKLKREFTTAAEVWALRNMLMSESSNQSIFYVQQGDALVKTNIHDIAIRELNLLELDEDDDIDYSRDHDIQLCCREENLLMNSFD